MSGSNGFELMVQVPADEWAYNKRRLVFLETVAYRLMRDSDEIQEWFTAAELVSMQLPGMPRSAGAITRKANAEDWLCSNFGVEGPGKNFYHVTALPKRAFDDLIRRLLDLPDPEEWGEQSLVEAISPDPVPKPTPENMAPPWVLPLMRLMKGSAEGNLSRAWRELPEHIPDGVALPTVEEAADVLVRFGLAKG